jgi:non-ribosomal peptide synthetase component E (peptide arylation enzyme)
MNQNTLTIPGLEQVYDALAAAVDQVGPKHTERFLVKLALMNANALADPALFQAHIDVALKDL